MSSIHLLIPLSLLLVGVAVWAFFWAVEHGQFEDLEGTARAALEEDRLGAEPDAGAGAPVIEDASSRPARRS